MKGTSNGLIRLAAIALWTSCVSVGAQPVRETAAGTVVTVPERVLVYLEDGRMEIVTRDVLLEVGAIASEMVPVTVPVFEVDENGNLSAGLYARNTSGHPVAWLEYLSPQRILWDQEMGYYVETAQMGISSTQPLGIDDTPWPVRDHIEVHLTPRFDLSHGQQRGENSESGPFQISLFVDLPSFFAAGFTAGEAADMAISVARVKTRIEHILQNSVGQVKIDVGFGPFNPTNITAATIANTLLALPGQWKIDLANRAAADNEPSWEVNMYNALPGNTVPFVLADPTVLQATTIILTTSVFVHVTNKRGTTARWSDFVSDDAECVAVGFRRA